MSSISKWSRLQTEYWAPDGSPMSNATVPITGPIQPSAKPHPRSEWGAWHTAPAALPGFPASSVKGQAAIAYYQGKPWTIAAFKRNIDVWIYTGHEGIQDVLQAAVRLPNHDMSIDWLAQQVGPLTKAREVHPKWIESARQR